MAVICTSERIGLAGVGQWGHHYLQHIAPAIVLRRNTKGSSRCVFAPPGARATHHFDQTESVSEWLERSDRVIIATPAATHAKLACAALSAGKPVLCEKPLCTSRAELEQIFLAQQKGGAPLLVGHIHLFNPRFLKLQQYALNTAHTRMVLAFGDNAPWPALEWLPHCVSMALACGHAPGDNCWILPGPFPMRHRSAYVMGPDDAHEPITRVYNSDAWAPGRTPLQRQIQAFVDGKEDWRWRIHGPVMDKIFRMLGDDPLTK